MHVRVFSGKIVTSLGHSTISSPNRPHSRGESGIYFYRVKKKKRRGKKRIPIHAMSKKIDLLEGEGDSMKRVTRKAGELKNERIGMRIPEHDIIPRSIHITQHCVLTPCRVSNGIFLGSRMLPPCSALRRYA